ncbi:nitroreductase family protein [Deinococcus peraridilitoris]|uniref:Nitroreductase n=1 Tax=Deinococcus peraridilitoris (strain DSM 19664 / LMG 22246 / CIP 109416 / KR-200) TaxID=937777 RepID=L0A0C5_DEIPD|nr:nitroreductase family protein [Deinococcus peraridilitoris]AFZ67296.1 nitroreductase [Deinococcus peraridilitoris DSM 19664]
MSELVSPDPPEIQGKRGALLRAIFARKTTNGPFKADAVSREHQHLLVRAAGAAPSHFNSQPWRFVLIEERAKIERIAHLAGRSMQQLIERGVFFERYRQYFRFSEAEMEARRDGIFIDQLPGPLRPFTRQVFSDAGLSVMRGLGVPARLGRDNQKLVATSPLLLAVLLDKNEYRPGQLSAFYSQFGLGAAMENIWLTVGELGMGIQFVSTPMEIPEAWAEIAALLKVPPELELMAVYRLGYLPDDALRPSIDWSSRHRKRLSQFVFREDCSVPEAE